MKESCHICFTSHSEVMFRCEEDHRMFVNLMALQSYRDEAELLADAEMSTHAHLNAFTDKPMAFASSLRMSYTKWFNYRHDRKGRLGEKGTFVQEVKGFYHQMTLLNYILRNGLHHGAVPVALAYPYCSVRDMFAEDLPYAGMHSSPYSKAEIAAMLPRHAEFPDAYRMNENGMFVRSSFLQLRKAEQYYATPRNFLYQMNRLTDEEWKTDQLKDNTGVPLTLEEIERVGKDDLVHLLRNETGRGYSRTRLQDMDVCQLIDLDYLPRYGVPSVYLLTPTQKERIFRELLFERRLPEVQIRRCLVFPR